MKKFLFGTILGAGLYHFISNEIEYQRMSAEVDSAMTGLFNLIPAENRFGYTEDFPADQKWEH